MASQTKKCPNCRTAVELDARHCPNCPYSFPEEGSGVPARRYGRRPPEPVFWALILAVIGLGCWRLVNFVMSYADTESRSNPITQATRSLSEAPPPAPEQQAAVSEAKKLAADGGPEGEADISAIEISHEAAATSPAPKPAKATAARRKPSKPVEQDDEADMTAIQISHDPSIRGKAARPWKEEKVTEWRFRGKVFDMITLEPIPGVQLAFKDPQSGRKVQTLTDSKGGYRLIVPALPAGAYSIVIDDPRYASAYMNPWGESVPALSEAVRLKTAYELTRSLDPPYDVQGGPTPVETDLYIAPRRVYMPGASD